MEKTLKTRDEWKVKAKPGRRQVAFRFEPDTIRKLEVIACSLGINKTAAVSVAINELYLKLKNQNQ